MRTRRKLQEERSTGALFGWVSEGSKREDEESGQELPTPAVETGDDHPVGATQTEAAINVAPPCNTYRSLFFHNPTHGNKRNHLTQSHGDPRPIWNYEPKERKIGRQRTREQKLLLGYMDINSFLWWWVQIEVSLHRRKLLVASREFKDVTKGAKKDKCDGPSRSSPSAFQMLCATRRSTIPEKWMPLTWFNFLHAFTNNIYIYIMIFCS